MRATAAVLEHSGDSFKITDVELEEPRAGEVLVRIASVGICGTDLEFAGFFPTPCVLGHEGAGIVEAVGSQVTSVAPGEHVAMSFEWRSILNGRTVTGIIAGSSLPQVFLPQLLELHARGRFPVDRLMTSFPFEQINEAIDALKAGTVGKAVLTL